MKHRMGGFEGGGLGVFIEWCLQTEGGRENGKELCRRLLSCSISETEIDLRRWSLRNGKT